MSDQTKTEEGVAGVLIKDGWFTEIDLQWPGQRMSVQVEEVLFHQQSNFQDVLVFRSTTYGNVLVLDGVVQLTERDEAAYQEMIAHLPLFSHRNPEDVLIIGGGDGGVLREVLRHSCVKKITICEIDEMVIDVGRRFFPSVSVGWDDARVTVIKADASKYIQQEEISESFDVIICDSSDPVGPAAPLFQSPFYAAMRVALRAGGRICTQAESLWLHLDLIKSMVSNAREQYDCVGYASTQVPTYPCGQIGFLVAGVLSSDEHDCSVEFPARTEKEVLAQLRYYTPELHRAAFVLPRFVQEALDQNTTC